MKSVVADPVGVPVHQTRIDADKRFEEISAATSLSHEFRWFFLGFAYCLVKIDRSLFEVFSAADNRNLKVLTHLTDKVVADVPIAPGWPQNPWAHTLQGIPEGYATAFMEFVESYQFKRIDTGELWAVRFREVRMANPLITDSKRPMSVWFAQPINLTNQKLWELTKPPGLLLQTPEFGPRSLKGANA